MKLSVSLPDADVATLDAYAKRAGLSSRSAALQHAVQLLRHPDLENDYAEAWAQWSADASSSAWENTTGDGITDAAR